MTTSVLGLKVEVEEAEVEREMGRRCTRDIQWTTMDHQEDMIHTETHTMECLLPCTEDPSMTCHLQDTEVLIRASVVAMRADHQEVEHPMSREVQEDHHQTKSLEIHHL